MINYIQEKLVYIRLSVGIFRTMSTSKMELFTKIVNYIPAGNYLPNKFFWWWLNHSPFLTKILRSIFRSSRPEVFCKKGVFKNFTKFTGKNLCQSFFFNKVNFSIKFIKKESLAQVFFCEFCIISKNTCRTPPVASSAFSNTSYLYQHSIDFRIKMAANKYKWMHK